MFCSKCKFTSFDHLLRCPKCGFEWNKIREDLQLAWLQAPGYNWFQHAEKLYQFDTQPTTATDQSPDYSFDVQDRPVGIVLPETHQVLLIEEVDLAVHSSDPKDKLPQPNTKTAQASPAGDHGEFFTPTLDLPKSPLTVEHSEIQDKTDTSTPLESEPPDQRSCEDVLAAWEIHDDLVAENFHPNANAAKTEPDVSIPGGGSPTVDHEDVLPPADIEYDFTDSGAKVLNQDGVASSDPQGAPLKLDTNFGTRENDQ